MIGPVDKALVLAAGNGDRFRNPTRESKLLQPVLGRPLIVRTSVRSDSISASVVIVRALCTRAVKSSRNP